MQLDAQIGHEASSLHYGEKTGGLPFLTLRTCSVADLRSTYSRRRSTTSAARSPCR